MVDDALSASADFLAQPFGVAGAVCVMLAVTAINSRRLTSKLETSSASGPTIFNGLNLAGGTCLFINAVIRSEIVWIVLETYFVVVAIKGLVQLRGRKRPTRDRTTPRPATEPKDRYIAAQEN